jgi:chemosensory pili system protein ChpA (sensor histidine kinase/response regulator)
MDPPQPRRRAHGDRGPRTGRGAQPQRRRRGGRPAQAGSQPVAAPAAPRVEAPRPAAPLPTPGATLRVNAETLDHLINESGEVAIARSRVEAGAARRQAGAHGPERQASAASGRSLREVEVQADQPDAVALSVMDEDKSEFDPLEFDRYTRLQELTRMMAEGLNDGRSIQQALLQERRRHRRGAAAAGAHQPGRCSRS